MAQATGTRSRRSSTTGGTRSRRGSGTMSPIVQGVSQIIADLPSAKQNQLFRHLQSQNQFSLHFSQGSGRGSSLSQKRSMAGKRGAQSRQRKQAATG